MLGFGGDTVQQERSTGNRFVMLVGIGESHEEIPPVVDKRHHAGHEAAAFEIVGGEATPTPLVVQFIKIVFGIRSIAVERNGPQFLDTSLGGYLPLQ